MIILKTLLEDFYTEDIEKHETLNQKLFGADNKLRPEVLEKINQIVELFVSNLKEDDININIEDIILVGSNVSYNYTKDSDLDIHILTDISNDEHDTEMLYGAYRSIFNRDMDIDFYGIPVEIYVECDDTPLHSNGIYSAKDNEWIKEPDQEEIPEIDYTQVEEQLKPFEERYNTLDENSSSEEVINLINDIYEKRKEGMSQPDAEYSIQNLVFKEFRNKGYLDNLKELRFKTLSKELSLESLKNSKINENLSSSDVYNYRKTLEQLVQTQVIVFNNGRFTIYNVTETDANRYLRLLNESTFVEEAHKIKSGKYNFNKIDFASGISSPTLYYTINGKLNLK